MKDSLKLLHKIEEKFDLVANSDHVDYVSSVYEDDERNQKGEILSRFHAVKIVFSSPNVEIETVLVFRSEIEDSEDSEDDVIVEDNVIVYRHYHENTCLFWGQVDEYDIYQDSFAKGFIEEHTIFESAKVLEDSEDSEDSED